MALRSAVLTHHADIGVSGEHAVVTWLTEHGYAVLARNFRSPFGEIDIVAQKNEVISFVEVKKRLSNYFNLSSVITPKKQRKLAKTANSYRVRNPNDAVAYRFDVALVETEHNRTIITYIEHAFTPEEIF